MNGRVEIKLLPRIPPIGKIDWIHAVSTSDEIHVGTKNNIS